MNLFSTIILGVVQGLTEFLPISSSGHLILFRDLLSQNGEFALAVDAVFQLATTFAILIYFHKDIWKIIKNLFKKSTNQEGDNYSKITVMQIIVASIPVIILGFLLENYMDTVFRSSLLVAGALIVGSIIMIWVEKKYVGGRGLDLKRSWTIGLFQALALIPGMSRSGMTISGSLFSGLNRELATRFSFIVALPVLFGTGLKKLIDLSGVGYIKLFGAELFWGSFASFIVGLLAIHFLIGFLKNHSLKVFAYYRIALAVVIIVVYMVV